MTGKHERPPAPVDVVRQALLEPVPCPSCGSDKPCRCYVEPGTAPSRTDVMAERILQRLTTAGLLHISPPPREATQEDYEATARWLAAQSRHPRYTHDPEGWRMLLTGEHNVDHAHAAAVRAAEPAPQTVLGDLDAARRLLIAYHDAARRATQSEGV